MRRLFQFLALTSVLAGVPAAIAQEKATTNANADQEKTKAEKGEPAPDFTMTGIDGKSFKLSERIGKDKNIIIMFSRANW